MYWILCIGAYPLGLLTHLQQLRGSDSSLDTNYLLACMIESLHICRSPMLVLPLAFRDNLVTYKVSDSPGLSPLNGSCKRLGAHTYPAIWVINAAYQPVAISFCVVFDNEQVLGKQ